MTRKMIAPNGEEIVYIEYIDNLPHQVLTAPIGGNGLSWFDFEYVYGDKKDIRYYESGGGCRRNEIQAPHFVKGTLAKYWMATDCKFNGRSKAKNCLKLDKPIQLIGYGKKSINPFNVSIKTHDGFDYCEICDHFTCDGNGCEEHQEWDSDKGALVYIHDRSEVN